MQLAMRQRCVAQAISAVPSLHGSIMSVRHQCGTTNSHAQLSPSATNHSIVTVQPNRAFCTNNSRSISSRRISAPISSSHTVRRSFTFSVSAAAGAASKSKPAPPSKWETVIGIEVHAQIVADSKLFSGASTKFGGSPNSHCSRIDAALPGQLPVLNRAAIEQAIKTGLGLGGTIQNVSKFERKHYFYCDMPQGYQITQQQFPLVRGGSITVDSSVTPPRQIHITRIQVEQDSGKSIHDLHPTRSYVDLNRAGVGLMEIVSEPDMRSSGEAAAYIRKLSSLLQALGVCRAHMEDGSLRADVNISVRPRGAAEFGERVEVKNLNSVRSLQRAIDHEVARQIAARESNTPVARETRTFDAKSGHTILLRSKENMLDYRFAPEPDLPPLCVADQEIKRIEATLPELPDAIFERLKKEYGLSDYDAGVVVSEKDAAQWLDQLVYGEKGRQAPPKNADGKQQTSKQKQLRNPKKCANWLTNELFGRLKKLKQDQQNNASEEENDEAAFASFANAGSRAPTLASSPVSAQTLGELIDLVESGTISGKVGKDVLDILMNEPAAPTAAGEEDEGPSTVIDTPLPPRVRKTPLEIVKERNWLQVVDHGMIDRLCAEVFKEFPTQLQAVQGGNKRTFGFLSGQVLKLSSERGAALNPGAVSKRMMELIEAMPKPKQ